ncbi:hypothetical protein PIB30_041312 [Stylosanthes scabra]|uniref:Uncharacterized protein n=1 Tax=Stylosanthes scabra TaxID=79078 RepID=A0ABU6SG77_9FABA|nr:hypothetical protein [Stylosanthes scabra]
MECIHDRFIGVGKSMRKAKKNIGSKNGLEKACKSGDFTKKEDCKGRNGVIFIGLEQTWTLWKDELNFYNFHVEDFFRF